MHWKITTWYIDGVFVAGVTHNSSCVSELTFDQTLEFTLDSLEHVDVAELIV
jgi:hypothetical protein